MVLKLELDSLDGVDEKLRGLYEENDGKFRLAVDGLPADQQGLITKLRKRERELETQLKPWEGKDAEEIAERLSHLEELERKAELEGKSSEQREAILRERLKAEIKGDMTKLTNRLTATETERDEATGKLRRYKVERALDEAADELKIRPEFRDDIRLRAAVFGIIDKEIVQVDEKGDPVFDDRNQPITPKSMLTGMIPARPGWVEGSSGGGAGGGENPTLGPGQTKVDRDDPSAMGRNLEALSKGEARTE